MRIMALCMALLLTAASAAPAGEREYVDPSWKALFDVARNVRDGKKDEARQAFPAAFRESPFPSLRHAGLVRAFDDFIGDRKFSSDEEKIREFLVFRRSVTGRGYEKSLQLAEQSAFSMLSESPVLTSYLGALEILGADVGRTDPDKLIIISAEYKDGKAKEAAKLLKEAAGTKNDPRARLIDALHEFFVNKGIDGPFKAVEILTENMAYYDAVSMHYCAMASWIIASGIMEAVKETDKEIPGFPRQKLVEMLAAAQYLDAQSCLLGYRPACSERADRAKQEARHPSRGDGIPDCAILFNGLREQHETDRLPDVWRVCRNATRSDKPKERAMGELALGAMSAAPAEAKEHFRNAARNGKDVPRYVMAMVRSELLPLLFAGTDEERAEAVSIAKEGNPDPGTAYVLLEGKLSSEPWLLAARASGGDPTFLREHALSCLAGGSCIEPDISPELAAHIGLQGLESACRAGDGHACFLKKQLEAPLK